MAQNITLLGASYSAVPAVTLPKTGGGTVTFTDVTDTTAAASDVASGKYFYTAAGVKTLGTSSGGNIGGLANLYDITNIANPWGYALTAIKKGNTVGGKVTYTSTFKQTESLLLSTGLSAVNGFVFICPTYDVPTNVGTGNSNKWILVTIYSSTQYQAIGMSQQNTVSYSNNRTLGSMYQSNPENGKFIIDGGDIYYASRYNNNNNYQIVRSNVEYEWLAW